MFDNRTARDPELIVDLIMEAVRAPSPKTVYPAGTLSKEFLGKRAGLNDGEFYRFMLEKLELTVSAE